MQRRWLLAGLALAAVLVIAVVPAPARLPRLILGFAYRGPLVDTRAWQAWVDNNPNLFGPLGETARFAVVETPDDSTGLLFTRTRYKVEVTKSHFLLFRNVPLLLAMSQPTAMELRSLSLADGNKFWDGVKFLVQRHKIVVFANAPRKELDQVGLTGFPQLIDAIPPKR
ncbi:MAG: hypothetical protein NVSMB68_02880 [Thermoanaerobaculia bacterium]